MTDRTRAPRDIAPRSSHEDWPFDLEGFRAAPSEGDQEAVDLLEIELAHLDTSHWSAEIDASGASTPGRRPSAPSDDYAAGNPEKGTPGEDGDDALTTEREDASSRRTSQRRLHELSLLEDDSLRWLVAKNPQVGSETLRQLAASEDWRIREAVASAGRTPADILASLATDPELPVRRAVAANHSAPPEVLRTLAAENPAWIAANPSAPQVLLESLAADVEAVERPMAPGTWAITMALAGNPATPTALLTKLSKHPDLRLRINLAGNPSVPLTDRLRLLDTLTKERDHYVRLWMCVNPNTPDEFLAALIDDRHRDVRHEAERRLEKRQRQKTKRNKSS